MEAERFLREHCMDNLGSRPPVIQVIASPFDQQWFASLPAYFQFLLMSQAVQHCVDQVSHAVEIPEYLLGDLSLGPDEQLPFRRLGARYLLMRGDLQALTELMQQFPETLTGSGYAGAIAVLQGRMTRPWTALRQTASIWPVSLSRTTRPVGRPWTVVRPAAATREKTTEQDQARQAARALLAAETDGPDEPGFRPLLSLRQLRQQ